MTVPFLIPGHTNVEMQNIDEEQDLQHTSPNGNAGGQEEKSGSNNDIENWKPFTHMRD